MVHFGSRTQQIQREPYHGNEASDPPTDGGTSGLENTGRESTPTAPVHGPPTPGHDAEYVTGPDAESVIRTPAAPRVSRTMDHDTLNMAPDLIITSTSPDPRALNMAPDLIIPSTSLDPRALNMAPDLITTSTSLDPRALNMASGHIVPPTDADPAPTHPVPPGRRNSAPGGLMTPDPVSGVVTGLKENVREKPKQKQREIENEKDPRTGGEGEGANDPRKGEKEPSREGQELAGRTMLNLFLRNEREREVQPGKIFVNTARDILRSDHIPEELPHREKEMNQIVSILSTAMHGGQPSNIFVYGTTGTGKTAVVLNVKRQVREIESLMIERGLRPLRMLYVNCRLNDTKYTLLSKIGNELSREGETIPSGWPTDRVYQQLLRNIDRMEATIVLVLDEVNTLVEKSGDEALYLLSRINPDLANSRLTIISITNNPGMWNILNPSVRSTLTPEDVYFEAYNAQHLRDILETRARSCFVEGSLEDGVIPRCAAIAAQEHGDARIALELLRKSGEIAERFGSGRVLNEHVTVAHRAIETSKTTGVIRGLSFHSKAVLLSIFAHARNGFRKVSTGEVYDVYGKICDNLQKPPLTQRRVSDLISELDMLGIARSLVISKGRYGRTKEINLAASQEDVREALMDDEELAELLDIDVNQRMI